jgi:hypothetical protein
MSSPASLPPMLVDTLPLLCDIVKYLVFHAILSIPRSTALEGREFAAEMKSGTKKKI